MIPLQDGAGKDLPDMIVESFDIRISRDRVFRQLDCPKGNPVYDQVKEEYEILKASIMNYIEPKAGIIKSTLPSGDEVLFVLLTIGKKGPELVSRLFALGNYLAGMVADAMLDDYLFQMDTAFRPRVIREAQRYGKGIAERLEAPAGIDISIQKAIHRELDAEHTMGVTITDGFMFDPVKSLGIVYRLSENAEEFRTEHDCSKCGRKECRVRQHEYQGLDTESTERT